MAILIARIKSNYQTIRFCKESGCNDLVVAKGLCRKHYDLARFEAGLTDKHGRRLT